VHIQAILTRPIQWELIAAQYDEMTKFATALRLGTADSESILRRFTRSHVQHPTYKALAEWGKALKTDLRKGTCDTTQQTLGPRDERPCGVPFPCCKAYMEK
jgi:hypothetical protein